MTPSYAWDALRRHGEEMSRVSMRQLFEADPARFDRFSIRLDDVLFDYSKNRIAAETMVRLKDLAQASDVEAWRGRMFAGERINSTERRAVLHTALRERGRAVTTDGADVMPAVAGELARMRDFAEAVREGRIKGATGERFTDVVNIGIGGSDLGPAMVTRALSPYGRGDLQLHFVSNVDGAHLTDVVARLDPSRTLFLVASKTFTTLETMTNAGSARDWMTKELGEDAVKDHFAALSTNVEAVEAFGIDRERMFCFWDWVGGRYSVWSAIGLPVAIAIGFDAFEQFLEGAWRADRHFVDAPLDSNIPVVMAMIGVWHRNVCGYASHAVIPYDQRLERFPAWLQQADMESNGKSVDREGRILDRESGPVIFGEPGTNAQHAFFQLLHQGTDVVPVDFLVAAEAHEGLGDHHDKLLANCLAQSEALMFGRTEDEAREQMEARGAGPDEARRLAPHKTFSGDRPSSTFLYRKLDPKTLGTLMALYEHKIFVQGIVWGINSFDQWGVELGKELTSSLLDAVSSDREPASMSGSTRGLIAHMRALRI